jgi:hypothetical protein
VAAAAVVSVALTVSRARTPPSYTVTVVLRVTEGQMAGTRGALGPGALRVHLRELTFTRPRLIQLVRSHPAEFPAAIKDPEAALEDIRDRIAVDISEGDFVEERRESDPPRSARVTVSFTASTPAGAWQVTHELADLLIDSTLARQRAALLREQASAESAVESAELHSEHPAMADNRPAVERLKARDAEAAAARLGLHAAEEQQALRFEMVDPGRVPAVARRTSLVGDAAVTFALALVVAGLAAGAFDPRVIDSGDLVAAGIPLLGRFPSLPGPPDRAERRPRTVKDAQPAPSDDRGPRV